MSPVAWVPVLIVLLVGCATPTLYSWGHYEESIYRSHAAPDGASARTQVEELEQDYRKAGAGKRRMPPGFHAHLGSMYLRLGQLEQARRELETEKAEFPESAVFIDRLLADFEKH